MKNSKLVIAMVAMGLASAVAQAAEEQKESNAQRAPQAQQVTGFGSGSGMGPGGGFGSPSSVVDGRSSAVNNSGTQSFGGGFNQQQSRNAGPLSTSGAAGSSGVPTLNSPSDPARTR